MATWPINELSGLLDPNVYVTGYTPTGVDVGADIAQVLNKANEVAVGANELKVSLDAGVVTDAAHDAQIAALLASLTTAFGLITANADDIDALETASYNALRTVAFGERPVVLLPDAYQAHRYFVILGGPTCEFYLPSGVDQADQFLEGFGPATIVNYGTSVEVYVGDNNGEWGVWSNGNTCSASDNYIVLATGESITVYPVDTSANTIAWAMIAGKTVSDLTT